MTNRHFRDVVVPAEPDFVTRSIQVLESKLSLNALSVLLLLAVAAAERLPFPAADPGQQQKTPLCRWRSPCSSPPASAPITSAAAAALGRSDSAVIWDGADSQLRSGPGEDNTVLFKVNPGLEVQDHRPLGRLGPGHRFRAHRRLDREKAPGPDLKKAGLYIHFPFCRRACFYCHFFKKKQQPDRVDEYLARSTRRCACAAIPACPIDTVYIGGGSPSLLTRGQVAGAPGGRREHTFAPAPGPRSPWRPIPKTFPCPCCKGFRCRRGQPPEHRRPIVPGARPAFPEKDPQRRSRRPGRGAVPGGRFRQCQPRPDHRPAATQTARKHGAEFPHRRDPASPPMFRSISWRGCPGRRATTATPASISRAGRPCSTSGFEHYEVSNFCRPGKASRHNLKYWRMEPYLGIGPSAAGFLEGADYRNVSDLDKYDAARRGRQTCRWSKPGNSIPPGGASSPACACSPASPLPH